MGYIWHLATPTLKDKENLHRDGLDYTWGDYTSKVASLIFARHQNASKVFCVNDIYDQDYNIKDHERRAAKEQNVPNLYMKSDDKFPAAYRFKQLLSN